MARRRLLRPDEAELWQAVARTARAMHPRAPHNPHLPITEPPLTEAKHPAEPRVPHFHLGERSTPSASLPSIISR